MKLDEAFVEVKGKRIEGWTSYRIASNLLVAADAFSMTFEVGGKQRDPDVIDARTELLELLTPGTRIRVLVGKQNPSPQMIGIIDSRDVEATIDGGFTINVSGRDNAGPLVDSSVGIRIKVEDERMVTKYVPGEAIIEQQPIDASVNALTLMGMRTLPKVVGFEPDTITSKKVREQVRFVDMVREAVAPWSIPVIAESSASRGILTGKALRQPRSALDRELDREYGLAPGSASRQSLRRARRASTPLDDLLGQVPSEAARSRTANGLTPGDVQRIKVKDARPQAGETVWDFISRHAMRFGLMMWMSPNGELILNAPAYNQPPTYRIIRRFRSDPDDPNNVLSGSRSDDVSARFSSVTVYGRSRGGDVRRARIAATVVDESAPYLKPLILHDQSIRTEEEARRRANAELTKRKTQSVRLEYMLAGHGQGYIDTSSDATVLYAIDTIATVHDDVTGTYGDFYVVSRTFNKTRSGTTTQLTLLPRGAIYLRGQEQDNGE